jgi:TRAP-type C4-dicarboxylate transport system permease small subunit
MRYVVGQPTVWVHEVSIALAASCFVIGGPYVHGSRRHITISYMYDKMPPTIQAWARLLSSLLTLIFLSCLAYATAVHGWQALQYGETTGTALNWPIPAYLKSLFAVCATVMSLQTVTHVIEDVARIRNRAS